MKEKDDKYSNPMLKSKIYDEVGVSSSNAMTINGAINKTALLLLIVAIGGYLSWNMYGNMAYHSYMMPMAIGGAIIGFILALVISFKPNMSPYLSPIYAFAEGLFLGAISCLINLQYPGVAFQAVCLTLLVAALMLFLYRFRIIKVTDRLVSIIVLATGAIAIFYLVSFVLSFFNINSPAFIGGSLGSSWIGIGINLLVVGVAAMNLLLDFRFIEQGSDARAPKFMEWYGAFGLTVTLVWLYLELLKLLARFAGRD